MRKVKWITINTFYINIFIFNFAVLLQSSASYAKFNHSNTCEHWQFECENKQCISEQLVCNGRRDCQDGSDESPNKCRATNNSCKVPASSNSTIIHLSCKNNPSNGYVFESSVVEVACAPHYYRRNVGNSRTTHRCRNKQWVPQITNCVKQGVCSESRETCVKAKNCANGSELSKLKTYTCRVENFVPGVCCVDTNITNATTLPPEPTPPPGQGPRSTVSPSSQPPTPTPSSETTPAPTLQKNATAIALHYCEQYRQYKYVNKWEEPQVPGNSGRYFNETHCVPAQPLIVSGTQAIPMEYPHMALVGHGKNTFHNVEWVCGGSLISEKFILSAAHCISSEYGEAKWVLLGDLNKIHKNDDTRPAVYSIVRIHKHPNHNATTKNNDIAIFELNTTVVLSPYVRPACLYTQTSKPIGARGSITGWGLTDTTGQESDHLLKVDIKVYNDSLCETRFNHMYNSTTAICAGDLDHSNDTCLGDSGGPFQLQNAEICMWDIFGITSFSGPTCGGGEVPSVYTNVAYYLDWIQNIVWP